MQDVFLHFFENKSGLKKAKALDPHLTLWTWDHPAAFDLLGRNPWCRYVLPVEYFWPTKTNGENFIERAAQGSLSKMESTPFINIQCTAVAPRLKKLSQNLRGRILQISSEKITHLSQSKFERWRNNPFEAPPMENQLHFVLDDNLILGGVGSPFQLKSFVAGARHYLAPEISRAAAKLMEAGWHLGLYSVSLDGHKKWLELGAAPGGMTRVLLSRGKRVCAVDRAKLDSTLLANKNLLFLNEDARIATSPFPCDALLCDMNGDGVENARVVAEQSQQLLPGSLIIFTLKISDIRRASEDYEAAQFIFRKVGLSFIDARHLYHNRKELTLFYRKI